MVPASFVEPNIAFLLLVLGALALFWEFHAPGMFVPGVLGILLLVFGAYGLYRDSPSWYGLTIMAVAALLLAVEFKYYTHMISGFAGTILLAFGATILFAGPRRVSPSLAISVSLAFGIITAFLGSLGMRAGKAQRVMGKESLIGEIGVARTEIYPEGVPQGMVFVRGEYWQARSDGIIPLGQRVRVERVQDLMVYVTQAKSKEA